MPLIYTLFNPKTKKFIGYTDDISNYPENTLFKVYEIEHDEFNLERFHYEGDYENGRLIDLIKENKSIVYEKDIDDKYEKIFFRKYSILDIVLGIVDDKLDEIKSFRKLLMDKKEREKFNSMNDPSFKYVSLEEQEKERNILS